MTKISIVKVSDNTLKVALDATLYAKEVIVASCYKFTNKYYAFQKYSSDGNCIEIILEAKGGDENPDVVIKEFCNELIDQQVRFNTNQQFGHIRDLIVEEAFKPVNK